MKSVQSAVGYGFFDTVKNSVGTLTIETKALTRSARKTANQDCKSRAETTQVLAIFCTPSRDGSLKERRRSAKDYSTACEDEHPDLAVGANNTVYAHPNNKSFLPICAAVTQFTDPKEGASDSEEEGPSPSKRGVGDGAGRTSSRRGKSEFSKRSRVPHAFTDKGYAANTHCVVQIK